MKVSYRISPITAGFILAMTGIVDILQVFLTLTVVGTVVSFVLGLLIGFILWLTFILHGVKYMGKGALKKAGVAFGATVLEMIPFIGALPLNTIGAVILILETRKEDREKAKKPNSQ